MTLNRMDIIVVVVGIVLAVAGEVGDSNGLSFSSGAFIGAFVFRLGYIMSAYWDEHRGQQVVAINTALAHLDEAGEWRLVEDGRYEGQHTNSTIVVDGEWLKIEEPLLGRDYGDEAEIALPDNLRLCRRIQGE